MNTTPIKVHVNRDMQRVFAELLFKSMDDLDYHEEDVKEIMDKLEQMICEKNGSKKAGGFASWRKGEGV